jgi:hypothetical protein
MYLHADLEQLERSATDLGDRTCRFPARPDRISISPHPAYNRAPSMRRLASRSQESRMPKKGTPKIVFGIAASFTGLAGAIIFLLAIKTVSVQLGILMLVASVGMHLGFGILIAVYRLIGKLE